MITSLLKRYLEGSRKPDQKVKLRILFDVYNKRNALKQKNVWRFNFLDIMVEDTKIELTEI